MPRLSRLTIAVASLLLSGPALAQDPGKDARTLDTLIVTGTRVTDRTVTESTSPIDTITPEVLQATGTVELATALSRAIPSLNFPRAAINDGTDAMRPAQLRGLAPDHTLVLVNGKRYHPGALVNVNGSQGRSSSPVDLNSIPIAAIERVEVLRDGASAQYGSDAIAGVVNIVGLEYPLTLSYGLEWRGEDFSLSPGEPGSYINGGVRLPDGSPAPSGSQVFPGFRPSDTGGFDRSSTSLYAGLEGDLTEKFSAGIAARYEKYSDFGSTSTGKLTGRYAFNEAVALRATASTGFHAPSLQQQFYQTTSTNFIGGIPFDIATFRVNNPAALALGSEPLKAETSKNLSLGLVLTPVEGLYVTIDGYQIKVEDRITLSEISPALRCARS